MDQAVWLWDETIFLALLTERRWTFYFDWIVISNRIENFKIESMVTSLIWKTPFFQLKSRFRLPNTTGAKKRLQRRKNWVSAFNWQTREIEKMNLPIWLDPCLCAAEKNLITFAFTRLKAFFILRKRNFNESLKCGLSAHSTPSAALMETRPASCFETRRDGLLIILNG